MYHADRATRLHVAGLVFLAVLLVLPGMARAADSADQHLKQGVRLLSQNRDKEALDEFRAAYALSPSPKAAAEMGLAEASLKLWLDAERHLSEALEATADDWVKRNKVFIDEQLSRTRTHLGWLTVEGTPHAEIVIDGAAIGRLPLSDAALRRPEGPVEVQARLPGHQTVTRLIHVVAESERTVTLIIPVLAAPAPTPVKLPSQPAPPLVRESRSEGSHRAIFYSSLPWVSMAAGAFALGDFALLLNSKRSCNGDSTCTPGKGLEVGVLLAGTAGFVMGGQALLMGAIRRPDPHLVKPILLVSSALAAAGAIVGGASLAQGDGYGSNLKLAFGAGTIGVGGLTLLFDALALFETTPDRARSVSIAVTPFPGGLNILGTF